MQPAHQRTRFSHVSLQSIRHLRFLIFHSIKFNPIKATAIASTSVVDLPSMAGSAESSALQTEEIEAITPSDGCINNDDVEEATSISTELDLRRHSSQDDRPCEIFERQILNHEYRQSPSPLTFATNFVPIEKIQSNNRLFNRSALNWLKNFNLMRVSAQPCETSPFMQQLQRCVSENTLLLTPEHRSYDLSGRSAIRKSFSSGILF